MALVIVDTSLLLVLTMVRRLDLLARHRPLNISRAVRREHRRCAPADADAYLSAEIDDGLVRVLRPGVAAEGANLQRKHRALSPEDAEGLAWAAKADAFFLTEDRRLLEAAQAESVAWVDLAALLMASRDEGLLSAQGLARLVAAIELDADHAISDAVKSALGV